MAIETELVENSTSTFYVRDSGQQIYEHNGKGVIIGCIYAEHDYWVYSVPAVGMIGEVATKAEAIMAVIWGYSIRCSLDQL